MDREHFVVPGFRVAAVAEASFGAHPSYAAGLYERDTVLYQEWNRVARRVGPRCTRPRRISVKVGNGYFERLARKGDVYNADEP